MIAYIERFLHETDSSSSDTTKPPPQPPQPTDTVIDHHHHHHHHRRPDTTTTSTTTTDPDDEPDTAINTLLTTLQLSPSSHHHHHTTPYSHDFGGIVTRRPSAVLHPTSPHEIATLLHTLSHTPPTPSPATPITVVARGNGHSISGQSLPSSPFGIVLTMRSLPDHFNIGHCCSSRSDYADVSGGALWEDVLLRCLEYGVAPKSWTDYLGLTVGGTLSNAGVSGQAFKYGPQTANVMEMEIVTGKGEVVVCDGGSRSANSNSELFFGVLGGLGQFGVITRARIPVQKAPDMVRWIRVVYTDFSHYTSDAEYLVTLPPAVQLFDYIEGFVFVNSDDPVNGYGSVPLTPDQWFDSSRIPDTAGPVLYCLEVAVHYNHHDSSSATVEMGVERILRRLRFIDGLRFQLDVTYMEFLLRVKKVEQQAKASGIWDAPHPWLNIFVAKKDIADFDRTVFNDILCQGIGGPMLVYPLVRSRWDDRTSVVIPDDGTDIFYIVALLRFMRPNCSTSTSTSSSYDDDDDLQQMMSQNRQIIRHCTQNSYDFKLYLPHYGSTEEWKRHFGRKWAKFVERKSSFDPLAVLAPGHNIFSRKVLL